MNIPATASGIDMRDQQALMTYCSSTAGIVTTMRPGADVTVGSTSGAK